MKYQNAKRILPEHLIRELQQYIQGEYLYIPANTTEYKKWGEKSGTRQLLLKRNQEIRIKYKSGIKMEDLSDEYCLSIHAIKKIIYTK